MSRNLTKTHLVIFLCSLAGVANAQQWLGRTTGNYSGTYGIYHNASSISDSKYKYYFNFWGRGVNFYNNYLTYNAPIKINHWANNNYDLQYQNLDGNVDMKKDWLLETHNGKTKQLSFNQDIWGPAFMFPVSRRWNMSINTRQRSSFQIYGISEEVARMARNGLDSSGGIYTGSHALSRNTAYKNGAFGVNMQSFQELSFTLGGVLSKSEHHQLSGGATVKFLRGLGASYVKGSNFDLTATGDNSAQINGDIQYAYTDQKSVVTPFNDPYGLFSLRSRGAGAGFDLGLNYTYSSKKLKYPSATGCDRNDRRTDYDFKLALAFNDIGGIRYNRNSNLYSFSSTNNSSVTAPSSILNSFGTQNQNGFDTIGQKIFNQVGATSSNGFNTSLPASINLQADFRITKHFYTGIYWNQSLKGFNSTGMRSTSMLSIIPRLESRGFEFSMPITLSENYKNVYVGAYTRIGPVFFGSDNLGGLLNVAGGGQFTGADIYGGVSFGIGHCHTWWYENKVDPVYMDSTRVDSFRSERTDTIKVVKKDTLIKHDTLRLVKHDTVYIKGKPREVVRKDTVYIEKIVKTKEDIERERIIILKENELNRRQRELELKEKSLSEKDDCKKCLENKVKNDAEIVRLKKDSVAAKKKIVELEAEVMVLKKKNTTEVVNGTEAEKLAKSQKQIDSLNVVLIVLRGELENCRKNAVINNAEIVKKAEADKVKAENDAKIVKKQNDSLKLVLDNLKKNTTQNNGEVVKKAEADKVKAENDARIVKKQNDSLKQVLGNKTTELDYFKKNATQNNGEVVKKAEADKVKAENDAKVVKKQNDSLKAVLVNKNAEIETLKKNSTKNNAEVVKKGESDKAKAENDARIAKKRADSLAQVLEAKILELENCRKNSTMDNADIVKKAEADKAKAENDARVSRKQADSLAQVLAAKNAELDNLKKNAAQFDAEVVKNKKLTDENGLLKTEMTEMSKTISKLNGKNTVLANRVDSLLNALKDCGKSGNSDDAELLKKCREASVEMNAEILRLKAVISARDKSLDSMEAVVNAKEKKQVELNAQVVKLNTEIAELKSKEASSNCDELQKQLNDKNTEINQLKNDAAALQNKVNNLNNQLKEQRTEYEFMLKRSQRCTQQLDSCMKGLYNPEHKEPGEGGGGGTGSGGPYQGSVDPDTGSDETSSSAQKLENVLKVGAGIINILQSTSSSNSSSSQSSSTSSKPTEPTGNGGNKNTGGTVNNNAGSGTGGTTSRTTETTTGNQNTRSGNNSDRNSSGSNTPTIRR